MPRNYTDQELVAMPRVNVELLDEVLDYIIDHPDEWNQTGWALVDSESPCGTTMCFAGHACALSGDSITVNEEGDLLLNGKIAGWFDRAKYYLGLNDIEAQALFFDTIYVSGEENWSDRQVKDAQLKNVKVMVEKIRARAKAQEAAFNRIAQEFIDAAGLDDVVKPGYKCPESEQVVQGITGGKQG